jgi:hypothetical protein
MKLNFVDIRRKWLQHGISRGKADARCKDLPNLRGNLPDPEVGHLEAIVAEDATDRERQCSILTLNIYGH